MKTRWQCTKVRVLFHVWSKAQDVVDRAQKVADWASDKAEKVQKELIGDLILEQSDIQAEFDQMTAA